MSPEQARGATAASDFRSDVFALGVLLYQILTGETPFRGDRPREILEQVLHHEPEPPVKRNRRAGRELSAICMKALAKDPRRRYPTAAELCDDLRRFLEFRPVSAVQPRLVDRIGHWIQRNRIVAAVLGTALFVGLSAGAYLGLRAHLSRRIVNQIFDVVEATRAEIETLNLEAESVADELNRGRLDEQARRSLELRLADLEARVAVKQIDNRSRLAAIVGFSLDAPDPRAVEQLRGQTFRFIDSLLEIEDLPLARAFVLSALESYERGNVLSYTQEEVRDLRRRQAEIESMLIQRGLTRR
jgi:serine/threonine protein kinase